MKKSCVIILLLLFQLGFSQNKLTETQKLATTCKVWGFLKYYHPNVANGSKDWDKQLFDILPEIENAKNKDEFSMVLEKWVTSLDSIKEVKLKKTKQKVDYFDKNFDLSWIKKSTFISKNLIKKLKFIEDNRIQEKQHYVNFTNGTLLEFTNETKYPGFKWTDKNLRILALFRYWNYVEYFFPYKYQMDQKWDSALLEITPKFIAPESELDFHMTMRELSVKLNDTHAFIGTMKMFDYFGNKWIPAEFKIIDKKAVITELYNDSLVKINDIRIGDVVTKVNGETIDQIMNKKRKYINGSNSSVVQKNFYYAIFNGNSDTVEIEFIRNNKSEVKVINRYLYQDLKITSKESEKYKFLKNNIAYVDMSTIDVKDVPTMMEAFKNATAIILDIRKAPNDTHQEISEYLNRETMEFAKVIIPDLSYPSRYIWQESEKCIKNNAYNFKGKVIILVNEKTQSHSEFTTMRLQTAENATIIGSQTSGADGDVCRFEIIKGFKTQFSGLGVFYPNKKETQRIGIVPDIVVKPTIRGIQERRDEVLDRAIHFIETGK